MQPLLYNSFQNRLEGWAYACPWTEVAIPGLSPMKRHIRFGARTSRRGDRCAYCEGGAYFEGEERDLSFFDGEGEGVADLRFAFWEAEGEGDGRARRGLRREGDGEGDSGFGLSEVE